MNLGGKKFFFIFGRKLNKNLLGTHVYSLTDLPLSSLSPYCICNSKCFAYHNPNRFLSSFLRRPSYLIHKWHNVVRRGVKIQPGSQCLKKSFTCSSEIILNSLRGAGDLQLTFFILALYLLQVKISLPWMCVEKTS